MKTKKKNDFPAGSNKSKGSFTVRILRIPRKDELPASGLQNRSLFRTTVVIPVRTLAEFFAAMQPEPEPAPQPGPAFRTQEEGPPVADSGGGGVDPVSTGVAAWVPALSAQPPPTVGELAAIALPGATGLLILTFGGGFIGYRQANSVRFIRAQSAERFLR